MMFGSKYMRICRFQIYGPATVCYTHPLDFHGGTVCLVVQEKLVFQITAQKNCALLSAHLTFLAALSVALREKLESGAHLALFDFRAPLGAALPMSGAL